MSKSKAPLALMELTLMALVLALAAALCLKAFAGADALSKKTEALDAAVLLAQNTAETLKAEGWSALGEETEDGLWQSEAEHSLTLTVRRVATAIPGLCKAEISVSREGETLFTLTAAWQEGGGSDG